MSESHASRGFFITQNSQSRLLQIKMLSKLNINPSTNFHKQGEQDGQESSKKL